MSNRVGGQGGDGGASGARRGAGGYRVAGALAAAEGAADLARETALLLERYVREVVLAFGLCPFLTTPDAGLGTVVVVLDPELDEATLEEIVASRDAPIVHAVYPLVAGESPPFERFASRVGTRLRARLGRGAPVSAAFHPAMHGESDDAHRLIGLLRRAPHPFVQYVPGDVTDGVGTTVAGAPPAAPAGAEVNFARLRGAELERVLAAIAALHEARDALAAPLVTRVLATRQLAPR